MKKFILCLLLGTILIPSIAFAADFRSGESILINQSENPKNLYLAGNSVDSNAPVTGDLVAAGSNVTIGGTVEESVMAAGGNVNLNGRIGNSARVAGGNILVNNVIAEDLIAVGGNIKIEKSGRVQNQIVAAGGMVEVNGEVGNIMATSGRIVINGKVNGDIKVKNVQNLTIGDGAVIAGKLTYSSPNQANISDKAKILGGVDYQKIPARKEATFPLVAIIYNSLASFLVLLVLIYLFPKFSLVFVDNAFTFPWRNLAWGFVILVVTPILVIAFLATIIGIKLALALGLLYIATLALASILTPLFIGAIVWKIMRPDEKAFRIDWATALIGVIAANLLNIVPFLGYLIIFIFFLISLGSLWTWATGLAQPERARVKSARR